MRRRSARITAAITAAHQGNIAAFQQAIAAERQRPEFQIQLAVARPGANGSAAFLFPSRPEMEEQIRRIMLNGFVQSLLGLDRALADGRNLPGVPEPAQPPAGASQEEIAALSPIPYSTDLFVDPQDATCSICLEDLKPGDILKKLRCPCKAYYHSSCIDTWLSGKRHCPMCRSDIVPNQQANQANQPANPIDPSSVPLRSPQELPV
jgi:hypothetical protein